jgi:glutamyl-tRNA reductase
VAGDLFVVGISWRTAPVAIREKLAFRDEEVPEALKALVQRPDVAEAMLISTCNRVEVYGVTRSSSQAAAQQVKRYLADERGGGDAESALYQHVDQAAIRHVFQVAAALDSLVLGEAQILGQLKQAYGVATASQASGPVLGRCLERAFGAAKRVRNETTIARGAANVSSVAVELATRVFGDLTGKTVLVVGAGKMSTLAARHLRQAGVADIVVTNRSIERAAKLAEEIDAVARPWEQLEDLLVAADVVVSSTGARQPILTPALFKRVTKARRWKPLMVVDIAVPRDADPAIAELDGVYLFDIDDLERVVAANLAERAKAAEAALRIVDHEVGQFQQWLRSQRVVPTIRAMREHFTAVAEAEVAKALDQLRRRDLSGEQRDEAVRRMGQLIVAKLLHQPQMALKATDPALIDDRIEAACALFGLDPSGYSIDKATDKIDKAAATLAVPDDAPAASGVQTAAGKRGAK